MARAKKTVEPATIADVRAWARENDIEVGLRGRLKPTVIEAFTKATKRPVGVAA